jgi:hypothetical protein
VAINQSLTFRNVRWVARHSGRQEQTDNRTITVRKDHEGHKDSSSSSKQTKVTKAKTLILGLSVDRPLFVWLTSVEASIFVSFVIFSYCRNGIGQQLVKGGWVPNDKWLF